MVLLPGLSGDMKAGGKASLSPSLPLSLSLSLSLSGRKVAYLADQDRYNSDLFRFNRSLFASEKIEIHD